MDNNYPLQNSNNNNSKIKFAGISLKHSMFEALYNAGKEENQDKILESWGLDDKELPAFFDPTTCKWKFKGIDISKYYVSKAE